MLIFYVVLVVVIIATCIFLEGKKTYDRNASFSFRFKNLVSRNMTAMSVAIIAALLAPWGVYSITAAIAKENDQTFYEYWNGSESATSTSAITCTRDGSCKHSYACDPYTVIEMETYTDDKGNSQTRPVTKTKYHDCPYSTQETDFIITTTIGTFIAGDSLMTGEEFRPNTAIPGGRQTAPTAWVEAKNRIDSGNPSGVTAPHKYKNFILSADSTLFKNYSDRIDSLLGEGLLPTPAANVHSLYKANKAYIVGNTNVNAESMNAQLTQLNGLVGAKMHGDMHIVFVEAERAGDPTDYTNALKAHWSSEAVGKNAIAKNTLTLVVGVTQEEGKPVVDWAKGFTGMPVGNEGLIQEFSNLKGETIDGVFIGSPQYVPASDEYVLSNGKVENMVTGTHKFARVSMSASDKDDNGGGFSYLAEDWTMKPADVAAAIWISSIVSAIIIATGSFASGFLAGGKDPVRKFITKAFSKN